MQNYEFLNTHFPSIFFAVFNTTCYSDHTIKLEFGVSHSGKGIQLVLHKPLSLTRLFISYVHYACSHRQMLIGKLFLGDLCHIYELSPKKYMIDHPIGYLQHIMILIPWISMDKEFAKLIFFFKQNDRWKSFAFH